MLFDSYSDDDSDDSEAELPVGDTDPMDGIKFSPQD